MIRILNIEYGNEPISQYFIEQILIFHKERYGNDVEVEIFEPSA
ncbi:MULTISPECIES: hypothetical protein [Aneurinibacillus]|nr:MULTISPECIES: hypothetical protein [Aneurinibacillus]MED0680373.1 hypothetical protein [Aneurinibacillus thermoaerophilus]MED0738512.1 hypothetical protein [Aneurinibacillus thermoaerophilus]MED0757057.1 hypothetical protein [Aneurinibacillus thermoaerophilus]MED0760449.1 hypothetical protein [Aneurinibacillus thermoaerophilus]MED0763293.1 hypothetical protein [Aneurinibacillus thermoaerophilus]